MDLSSLQAFLSSAKSNVDKAVTDNLGDTYVILGNDSADMDSIISSIVTAYYTAQSLSKEEKENLKAEDQQSFVFPVINCSRDDIPLRTEVNYFLKSNGIRSESLICRDELDIAALHCGGKLKLTLVDHNMLSPGDVTLSSSVIRVIDHHKREKPLDRRDIIEPVGSCATLVAEMVLGLFDRDPIVCSLLYGTILLDTVNLSPAAQRTTPKDLKAVSELEECLAKLHGGKKPVRDDVYTPIVKARSDISQLSTEQLLRKDCKFLKTPEISIAIPAVPLLSQKFLELPGAIDALKQCQRNNRCTAVVLMGWDVSDLTNIRRDLVVFADGIHKAKQVCTPLENCENLHLQLIRHSTDSQSYYWLYDQRNVGLSRKFILPFLATHFEVKAQSQLDVDALAGVEILIPNGEMSPNKHPHPQVPAISYSSAQNLGVGDPISHGGSNQSSAYNSCPYTPQNSCAGELEDGYPTEHYFLPSFNSREMIEKIEYKRHKLRGYDKGEDSLNPGGPCSSYPFTPKNSYVDSSMEGYFNQDNINKGFTQHHGVLPSAAAQQAHAISITGGILNSIDSEVLLRKLMEKRRGDSNSNSNTSSKSQSLTKLNTAGDEYYLPGGDTFSHQISPTPPLSSGGSGSGHHQFQYNANSNVNKAAGPGSGTDPQNTNDDK